MKQTPTLPSPSQRQLLQALAEGAIIAVVHTRGGTIASLFPRVGRHRNISYKVVAPLLEVGWVEDVVPEPLRWRGSKYVISQKGRNALAASHDGSRQLTPCAPSASEPSLS